MPDYSNVPVVSIGRKKADDGEPLVEVSCGGILGTLDQLKAFIARYDDANTCPGCESQR